MVLTYQKQGQEKANEGHNLGEVIDVAGDGNPSCRCDARRCNEQEHGVKCEFRGALDGSRMQIVKITTI